MAFPCNPIGYDTEANMKKSKSHAPGYWGLGSQHKAIRCNTKFRQVFLSSVLSLGTPMSFALVIIMKLAKFAQIHPTSCFFPHARADERVQNCIARHLCEKSHSGD